MDKEPQESVAISDNTNSVPLKHQNKQSHLDTNGTLSHLHVSNSLGDVVPFWLSSGDQIALSKLHRLPKSGAPQLQVALCGKELWPHHQMF